MKEKNDSLEATKKMAPVKNKGSSDIKSTGQNKGKRSIKNIPSMTFEDALVLANGIWTCASGQRVRKLTLFDHLQKSPDSGRSRALITASSKYGLTNGGYQAEYIELTSVGRTATDPDGNAKDAIIAKFQLAVQSNVYFNSLYEAFKNMKLPSNKVMEDTVIEAGLDEDEAKRCVETFVVNAKYLGLVQMLSGAERIISIEQLAEDFPDGAKDRASSAPSITKRQSDTKPQSAESNDPISYDNICFYITPIGDEGSEIRKHSDMMLECIIAPVLEEFHLRAVRADQIDKPGMITNQILDYITKSRMVIADLSFHNPNVFYELAVRHMKGLPSIHLSRTADKIPFDISGFRTISLDMTDIYSFVPQLETYKSQISSQLRSLLEANGEAENPISSYLNKT